MFNVFWWNHSISLGTGFIGNSTYFFKKKKQVLQQQHKDTLSEFKFDLMSQKSQNKLIHYHKLLKFFSIYSFLQKYILYTCAKKMSISLIWIW